MGILKIKNCASIKHKPFIYICLSFIIPFFVLLLGIIALHIIPFGDKHNLAITDARYYLNGVMNFVRRIKDKESMFYSLQNGLGGNNWANLAWGGFQPVSLLAFFATLETIPSWYTWICVINMSLGGLSMYILLAGMYGHRFSHLIFSTAYSMMGFSVVNCYQAGFFHGVQLLPLMMLGLFWLFNYKSPLLYIMSLGSCIFLNFYFGFMLCIASVVVFFAYLYVHDEFEGRRITLAVRWGISSIISGLLAAPMWLPALKAYSGGGRINQTELLEFQFSDNMPFIQIFSKLFSGANSKSEVVNGLPNIFCGILIVALGILFFLNKNIIKKEKIAAGSILLLYLLSFYIKAFTLLMHGGTHTNWFPYRYSFVFSFFMIIIAAKGFNYIDHFSIEDCQKAAIIIVISTIAIFSVQYDFISGGCVVFDLALLCLMFFGFYLYKTKPETTSKHVLYIFLLIVSCGNLYANFVISTQKVQEWELDLEQYYNNIRVSGALTEALNNVESDFFRMEKETSDSGSIGVDPLLYNYHGVSHSGPTERDFVHKSLCRLGINWFDMRHWYSKGIPASTDSLLGLKYILADTNLSEIKGYEKRAEIEGISIYQNPYYLPISILIDMPAEEIVLGENVFDNLNVIWRKMCDGDTDIFTKQEEVIFTLHSDLTEQSVTSSELQESLSEASMRDKEKSEEEKEADLQKSTYMEYSFIASQDGPIYFFDTSIPESPQGLAEPAIKLCGLYKKGDEVKGQIPIDTSFATGDFLRGYCQNLVFAYENLDVLFEYAKQLNSSDISFEVVEDSYLKGSYTAKNNQCILFTIPWDEGWSCYIDGQKVPINKTWDLFMSIDVPKGQHVYEMKFVPAWLNYGLLLCAIAIILLAILMVFCMKNKKITSSETPANSTAATNQDKILA